MGSTGTSDARNEFRGRRDISFRIAVSSVIVTGGFLLALQARPFDLAALAHPAPALSLVVLLVAIGELRPVFTGGCSDENGLLVTNAFLFAVLLRYGVTAACVIQAVVTTMVDVGHRKAAWRVAFNVGQYTLAWSAAGLVFGRFARLASLGAPLHLEGRHLLPGLAAGIAYFVVNQLLVSLAVSLKTGEPLPALLRRDLPYEGLTNGALLALAPLIAVAMERGVGFVPLLLPPLFAVYQVAEYSLRHEREARCDALTGLPNRTLLLERTEDALRRRHDGRVALAVLDLDRFKAVNDTLGHHAGDELLRVVGARLLATLRAGDVVARLGGDEFALLLPQVPDVAAARDAALRMVEAIAEPILLEGVLMDVGASVGVAVSPDHGTGLDVLLQRADVAMYTAKSAGGGVAVYDPASDLNTANRLGLLGELRRALADGEFVLHFQPQVGLPGGEVVGVEALLRWQHPVRGLVPPDEFLPEAEQSDVMTSLTAWVLDAAAAQAASWNADGLRLSIAVNISARDLCGPELVTQVEDALHRHGVDPGQLVLEITEGSLFADPDAATTTLRTVAGLGVALSLDDFGTRYSALGHLRERSVSEIKLDRSFVHRIDHDRRDLEIVRGLVGLGRRLEVRVVAEGVETEPVRDQLIDMGCDFAQGWLFGAPAPAHELTPWLHEQRRVRSAGSAPDPVASGASEPAR